MMIQHFIEMKNRGKNKKNIEKLKKHLKIGDNNKPDNKQVKRGVRGTSST